MGWGESRVPRAGVKDQGRSGMQNGKGREVMDQRNSQSFSRAQIEDMPWRKQAASRSSAKKK